MWTFYLPWGILGLDMVFWWCLLTLKLSTPKDLFKENQVQDVPVERSNMWCEDPVDSYQKLVGRCWLVGFKISRFS